MNDNNNKKDNNTNNNHNPPEKNANQTRLKYKQSDGICYVCVGINVYTSKIANAGKRPVCYG